MPWNFTIINLSVLCQEGFPQPKKSDFSLKNSQGTEKLQISAHHQQNCTLIILSPMLVIVLYHDIITTQGKMFTVCDICQHLILFLHAASKKCTNDVGQL